MPSQPAGTTRGWPLPIWSHALWVVLGVKVPVEESRVAVLQAVAGAWCGFEDGENEGVSSGLTGRRSLLRQTSAMGMEVAQVQRALSRSIKGSSPDPLYRSRGIGRLVRDDRCQGSADGRPGLGIKHQPGQRVNVTLVADDQEVEELCERPRLAGPCCAPAASSCAGP